MPLQIIADKDKIIHTLSADISLLQGAQMAANRAQDQLSIVQTKLTESEARELVATKKVSVAVRAERSLASHHLAAVKKKHMKAIQRETDAVTAVSNLSDAKINTEKEKVIQEKMRAAELLITIGQQRQDCKTLNNKLSDAEVGAKQAQRDQRKELMSLVNKKKADNRVLARQVKDTTVDHNAVKRVSKQRDNALHLATKRQETIDLMRSMVDSLRAELEAKSDSLVEARSLLNAKNNELASLQRVNNSLSSDCTEATEEVVVCCPYPMYSY